MLGTVLLVVTSILMGVLGTLVAPIYMRARGVPLNGIRTWLSPNAAHGVLYVVLCLLVGAVIHLLGALFRIQPPAWLPAAAALMVAALTMIAAIQRGVLPMTRLAVLSRRLGSVETRAEALSSLHELLAERGHMRVVRLHASAVLGNARLFREMLDVLEPLTRVARLGRTERLSLHASLAVGRIYTHRREDAWQELRLARAAARRPREYRLLDTLEALLLALEGEADHALEMAGERPVHETQRRGWLLARAHAFAARGDEMSARAALVELHRLSGMDGLARAVDLDGPASVLARDMHHQVDIPYR